MSEPLYDIAVVGSGFVGSLIAMIARRLGRSVVLLERGRHPRTVIGESSTPLSNLLLEDLAARYDLDELRSLSKWGTWQQTHPELACGLKRGFTFYHHDLEHPRAPDPERRDQLLVAASPHDRIADTHWYRADFDHFLVEAAQRAGVDYLDDVHLDQLSENADGLVLEGRRQNSPVTIRARFVIDATGPRGLLHRALGLGELRLPDMPPTQALYSHFTGVGRLSDTMDDSEAPPYSPDDAAVHHVFPSGWIWVLRFNNGVTSAGVAVTDECAAKLGLQNGAPAWDRLIESIPALRRQCSAAQPLQPFTHLPRLSFRSGQITGKNWALLPSAAGFVDPLLSTGFALTLLGVRRLASIFEEGWGSAAFAPRLEEYAARTDDELLAVSRLVGALYASMDNFPVFTALTMLYFAAVSYAETAHRLGRPELAPSFLLHDHPTFGPAMDNLIDCSRTIRPAGDSERFAEEVRRATAPINVAGLADPKRRNWYPVDAHDLFENAHKLGATREAIERLLERCGFESPASPSR